MLELQAKIVKALSATPRSADQIASDIGAADAAETVYLLLEHLAANGRAKISPAAEPGAATFCKA